MYEDPQTNTKLKRRQRPSWRHASFAWSPEILFVLEAKTNLQESMALEEDCTEKIEATATKRILL